ncbi:MAG TPA: hypothetical protein VEZ90_08955, partial [Blastocatellia bacterium]|nr:hypothetical protein [Blastocatellia bacterium]
MPNDVKNGVLKTGGVCQNIRKRSTCAWYSVTLPTKQIEPFVPLFPTMPRYPFNLPTHIGF